MLKVSGDALGKVATQTQVLVSNAPTEQKLGACDAIRVSIEGFMEEVELAVAAIDAECEGARVGLLADEERVVVVTGHIRKVKGELAALAGTHKGIRGQLEAMQAEIASLQEGLSGNRQQFAEAIETRKNGLIDLIPVVGIVTAISSGDARRAIPLYSAARAIASIVEQDAEKAWLRIIQIETEISALKANLDKLGRKIEKRSSLIQGLNDELRLLKSHQQRVEGSVRAAAKKRTDLLNLKAGLESLLIQCHSLDSRAVSLKKFVELGLGHLRAGEFIEALEALKATKLLES